jgi:hypothetical protein
MDETDNHGTGTIGAMFAIVGLLMLVTFIAWQVGLLEP